MSLKIGDIVKRINHLNKPIGKVIYVYQEDQFIHLDDGSTILYAGPGDVTVNFDRPYRDDRGSVLSSAELEKMEE